MTLTSALASAVSQQAKDRGETYYRQGKVEIVDGSRSFVEAYVQGTEEYKVLLERQGNNLFVSCLCPYAQENITPCKHLWATILAAEASGYLGSVSGKRGLKLLVCPDLEDELEGADAAWEEDGGEEDQVLFEPPRHWSPTPSAPFSRSPYPKAQRPPSATTSQWKDQLEDVRRLIQGASYGQPPAWPENREIVYVLYLPAGAFAKTLTLNVGYRTRKKDGAWGKIQFKALAGHVIPVLPDPTDRGILGLLAGIQQSNDYYSSPYASYGSISCNCTLAEPLLSDVLPRLCETGRCYLSDGGDDDSLRPISWDDGPPWEFRVDVALDALAKRFLVAGQLQRGEERRPLRTARALLPRLVFWDGSVAQLSEQSDTAWMQTLRGKELSVPRTQADKFIRELLRVPRLPPLNLPEELRFESVPGTPRPMLTISAPGRNGSAYYLPAQVAFDYEGQSVERGAVEPGLFDPDKRRLMLRDAAAEERAVARLGELGFRPMAAYANPHGFELPSKKLPGVVHALLQEGWHVEAAGKLYRKPGAIKIDITSGIDWFELHGSVAFGDTIAHLPELLAALRRGENTVPLGDGTFGVLPEEWLRKYGVLAGLGTVKDKHLEFRRSQAGLLDALLAAQPEATFDVGFSRVREELRAFSQIEGSDPPAGFVGRLRAYQREGLGWLHFLQRFGFGGCLADDMGLGKTIQVLALLEERRTLRSTANGKRLAPSLVVVPRSLVFNWKQEAARFTPELRLLDYTLAGREASTAGFDQYDLILTTYGTLRKDVAHLKDYAFDCCILDEAQAVKNPSTESAKAVRLLSAAHRLALSGTPIENHLGELWSLFEFLNPGMLGSAAVFRLLGVNPRSPDPEARQLLARALRPFMLRRTKTQVAKDLPEKVEQTIFCELEPVQRRLYNELRDHFRLSLQKRIEREGINKAKIHVLEALLRLRQAACHPGLIDQRRTGDPSAKLDTLLLQLDEVAEAGHKALVFSQFTSFLAIVRARLDKHKTIYAYLDGQTRDRQARVKCFQEDPSCKLFLISLKAGGLGLNLTAAEYVFLLDPWWNPAVEAQAIDRTHRIGQTREVFAYRLIARDTVEEKVLELQRSKRDLADAIINADNSLIGKLTRADMELLLS